MIMQRRLLKALAFGQLEITVDYVTDYFAEV
jgi:hypothetical protein